MATSISRRAFIAGGAGLTLAFAVDLGVGGSRRARAKNINLRLGNDLQIPRRAYARKDKFATENGSRAQASPHPRESSRDGTVSSQILLVSYYWSPVSKRATSYPRPRLTAFSTRL